MDIPAKKLARLLHATQPADVRAAATIIAGELSVKETDVAAAVLELLTDPSATVRLAAIKAAGKLKIDKALPVLLERIAHGGDEGNQAARSVAALGAKGIKALQELIHKVVPGVRKYIAAALAESGTDGANAAGILVFLEPDATVADAAATTIISHIPEMSPAKRESLAKDLLKLTQGKKPRLPAVCEPALVRVLSELAAKASAQFLWERTQPPHHPEVRSVALNAVSKLTHAPSKDQWAMLFRCAAESEFRVAGPALTLLEKLPGSDKFVSDWMKLLEAPDVAARRSAVQKIGELDNSTVAAGLIAQLNHHDRGLRDAAAARLVLTSNGRTALAKSLASTSNHDEAWTIARAMAPAAKDFSAKLRQEILQAAGRHIESGSNVADALLFFLREADSTGLRDGLLERATELRKKKKYEEALGYLKLLGRDPGAGFPIRLELACVGLKQSPKELDRMDRLNDPCLTQFSHIADLDAERTLKELEKAKWVEAEDLFYVGFHFAEDLGKLRHFGAEVLKLCLKRSPKGKVAAHAKTKLKTIVE